MWAIAARPDSLGCDRLDGRCLPSIVIAQSQSVAPASAENSASAGTILESPLLRTCKASLSYDACIRCLFEDCLPSERQEALRIVATRTSGTVIPSAPMVAIPLDRHSSEKTEIPDGTYSIPDGNDFAGMKPNYKTIYSRKGYKFLSILINVIAYDKSELKFNELSVVGLNGREYSVKRWYAPEFPEFEFGEVKFSPNRLRQLSLVVVSEVPISEVGTVNLKLKNSQIEIPVRSKP